MLSRSDPNKYHESDFGGACQTEFENPTGRPANCVRLIRLYWWILIACAPYVVSAAPPAGNWVQTFDDEFTSFNSSNCIGVWKTAYPWGPRYTINNELEYYVDTQDPNNPLPSANPFSVSNGILTIRANKNSALNNKQYTSGVITTFDSFNQMYGYFEMCAKLPAGKGLWPAFWLLPKNSGSPPELDIMEAVGSQPTTLYTTGHSTLTNPTDSHCYPQVADMTAGFHTYGFHWNRSTLTWYFDDIPVCQFPTQSDQNQPFYILLNLGIGSGGWTGTPDSTNVWPADYRINYVRIWQQSDQNPAPCVGPNCPQADDLASTASSCDDR